jgi:NAD(P)-dependent dehydrogenase (short-subunit alcohol dehydrogenase family)
MDLGIAGRACAVTGGTSGIGLASARALEDEGARVLLVARGEDSLAQAAASIGVTSPDSGERLVSECERHFGALDVLVNNAGTSRARALDELTDDEWDEQWQLHVMAPMRLMRAAAPAMAGRGWGRIVNVGSSAGKRPSLTNASYTVSKAAQHMLARVFADTYAAQGVLVNTVAPGPVETPLWMGEGGLADQAAESKGVSRAEALEAQRAKIPLGRFATEDEIAAAIVFLCSERASDVTGANWSVDGGIVPFPF